MRVLLIEDEEHKAVDLTERLLASGVEKSNLVHVSGVRQAVLEVMKNQFDLIVVDMALPTFTASNDEGSGGGTAQAVGGIEILRALENAALKPRIIIVTQYPDIIVSGKRIKLSQAGRVLSQKYGQSVLGAVLYSYKTPEWAEIFDALLRKAK